LVPENGGEDAVVISISELKAHLRQQIPLPSVEVLGRQVRRRSLRRGGLTAAGVVVVAAAVLISVVSTRREQAQPSSTAPPPVITMSASSPVSTAAPVPGRPHPRRLSSPIHSTRWCC